MSVIKRGLHIYPDYLDLPKDMLKQLLVHTPFILPESDIVLTHDDILELLTINYINPEDVYYYLKSKTK